MLIYKQIDRQINRQLEILIKRQIERLIDKQTNRFIQIDKQINRLTYEYGNKEINEKINRLPDEQITG